jgi:adenylate kinase family enzyme
MKVPRIEDLMEIAQNINDLGFLDGNITIFIEVDDKKILNRINDDFFYRYKDEKAEKVDDVTEVNVSVNGVQFIYFTKQAESTENESNKK